MNAVYIDTPSTLINLYHLDKNGLSNYCPALFEDTCTFDCHSALFILEARLVGSLWTKLEQDGHVNIKMDIA